MSYSSHLLNGAEFNLILVAGAERLEYCYNASKHFCYKRLNSSCTCQWCDNGVRMAVPELILRSRVYMLVACERCINYVHFVVSSCSSLVLLPCAQLFICLVAFTFLFSVLRAFELLDASNAELRKGKELVSVLCLWSVQTSVGLLPSITVPHTPMHLSRLTLTCATHAFILHTC